MEKRINISSDTKWENLVGYSRVVKVDKHIEVAGTVAIEDGQIIGIDDAYVQTVCIIRKIEHYLNRVDAKLQDVVRTRIFVTDISRWKEVGKAHGEFFKDINPVTTLVEVKSLIDPELLVEIEATAIID